METKELLKLSAFENIEGFKPSIEITNLDRLHVAICGPPKTGKSNLVARTARRPLIIFDGDNRRESIAGIDNVFVKTYTDTEDTTPKAWAELETDVAALTYAKQQKKLDIKSACLDSITFWRRYAEHQFLKDSNSTSRASYTIGQTKYLIPKDWDAVTGVQKMLDTIINRLFDLDIDVYVIFHTRQEKDNAKSTKTDPVYKDNLTVEPQNLSMLLPKFNDCWRTFVENGEYKIQLKPDYIFNAATVLKNVAETEKADIQELLRKHNGQ